MVNVVSKAQSIAAIGLALSVKVLPDGAMKKSEIGRKATSGLADTISLGIASSSKISIG